MIQKQGVSKEGNALLVFETVFLPFIHIAEDFPLHKKYDEQEQCEAERDDFTDSDGTLHMQSILISYNKKYEPKLVSPLVGFSIVGRVLN